MEDKIREFITFKEGGRLKKRSAEDYNRSLTRFNKIIKKPLEELKMQDVVHFRNIVSLKYSPKTIQHDFTILRSFVKFWSGEVKCISPARIEVPRARSNPHLTIEEWEHRKLLSVLQQTNYPDLQKILFLNLLWDTGARCGELMSIDLKDIDFDNRRVRIHTEKTKKQRVLFWGHETHDILCKYLPIRWEIKRSNALFVGLYNSGDYVDRLSTRTAERWIRKLCVETGISRKIVPHSYRHSRIQRWISSGISLIEVTYLSGHESMTSLEHYMRLGVDQIQDRARRVL